jgi:hypothetical protein
VVTRPLLVHERADLHAVLGAATDLHRGHPVGEPGRELVRDRLVHQEAVGRRAGLADVAHLGQHRALDCGIEVRILEDQERRVSAQFHGRPQNILRRVGQ